MELLKASEFINRKNIIKVNSLHQELNELNIQNVVPRPPTPVFDRKINGVNSSKNDEAQNLEMQKALERKNEIYKAAVLFQKIIKGRAIQNIMFDGKEKRLALIGELLKIADTDNIDQDEEKEIIERELLIDKLKAEQEGLQGKFVINNMAEEAESKLKMNDLDKLTQFMLKAEEERKRRENKETGTRQAEIVLKNREELLNYEVMKVHQNTIGNQCYNI